MTRRNGSRLALLAGALTIMGAAACSSSTQTPISPMDASSDASNPSDASPPVSDALPQVIEASVLGTTCVMPNPASSGLPNPAMYDTSIAGTVFDRLTGLMWQRSASSATLSQAAATAACKASILGGYTDWRLPTVLELVSIVDYTATSPSIDSAAFPGTTANLFWTVTPLAGRPHEAWYVNFIQGGTNVVDTSDFNLYRCVRTALNMAGACYAAGARFKMDAGTVTDASTGLVWQQMAASAMTWSAAKASCTAAGAGFRLPSLKELQTIVDYGMAYVGPGPAIDATAFPGTPVGAYWTSSAFSGSDSVAWMVRFSYGDTASSAVVATPAQPLIQTDPKYVRCVH
jgi:Protein of unknown function (DUF1566)